jgi:hypothetical protein
MTNPRDTRPATELSREEASLVKRSPTRGYVPRGEDVEPDQAPTGAASASTPTSEVDDSANHGPEFRS